MVTARPTVVYVAHPYGGDPANLARARRWVRWLNREFFPRYAFIAPWIDVCDGVPETPWNRTAGIAFASREVAKADELWMVGGRVSDGMKDEAEAARFAQLPVRSFVCLGHEPGLRFDPQIRTRTGCHDLDPNWPDSSGRPRGPRLCVTYPGCPCGASDREQATQSAGAT